MKKRIPIWVYPTIEAVVFLGLGAGLWKWSKVDNLTLVFASLAAIFVIHRIISSMEFSALFAERMNVFEAALNQNESKMEVIGSTIDLAQSTINEDAREISQLYLSITEPHLAEFKRRSVQATIDQLSVLKHTKRTPIMEPVDFYSWLFEEFSKATKNSVFEVVSLLNDVELQDTVEEKKFAKLNLEAAKKGASITRIFILDKHEDPRILQAEIVKLHHKKTRNGLVGRTVLRSEFARKGSIHLERVSQGFIIIDRNRVVVDDFTNDSPQGYVTFKGNEVTDYIETYRNLHLSSEEIDN